MKPQFLILSFGLILLLGSCGQKKSNDNATIVKVDSFQPDKASSEPSNEINLKQVNEEISDSLYLSNILQKALKIAQKKANN